MTRDEALVKAALRAAAVRIRVFVHSTREGTAQGVESIDPQAIIASVGPDAETVRAVRGKYRDAFYPSDQLDPRDAEIERLRAEIEKLSRGEFICRQCGLRKDSDKVDYNF